MASNREEDKKMNEAFSLNQGAIGDQQARNPNGNLKYPANLDAQNSNLRQFAGLTGNGSMNAAQIQSTPDLSSDNEGEKVHGYIYNSEQSKTTPENPEIVVVGLGRYDLESLRKHIQQQLKEMSEASDYNIISYLTDKHSPIVHKAKALKEVLKDMDQPSYKRKITLAKQKRRRYNIRYGDE